MHEGHRQRMYEKLINEDFLYPHELLEILLFNAYPRVNTNPIAHELLKSFGSLSGVFEADASELVKVNGVGERVAYFLKCVGACMRNINKTDGTIVTLKSYEDFQNFTALRFSGHAEEVLEIYCMEKSGKVMKIFTFTSNEIAKVKIDTDRISKILATFKPYGILIAHNHLSGAAQPSENDDKFTMHMQVMCSMNNVNLFDHCIYAGDEVYSYFLSGKIEIIKSNYSVDRLVDGQYRKDKLGNKN